MNIRELHKSEKQVSATSLFKGELGIATSIQIEKDGTLAEHFTKTQALLLCIFGEVTYRDENEQALILKEGDYISIEPDVKHWLYSPIKSQLILLK